MDFRIADIFTDSLSRLTGDEQKSVKTTAFDLQMNPASPGMSLHRVDKARDKNFWSVRVTRDIRLIVHRTNESLLLCYVGHHDDAYHWTERRKIETHPTTGAAQIVEIRERVEEIRVSRPVDVTQAAISRPSLFSRVADSELLACGVPEEWLPDVRGLSDEDALLALTDHLPAEAAEALLEFATGSHPAPAAWAMATSGAMNLPGANGAGALHGDAVENLSAYEPALTARAFEHPDAQRRFRRIDDAEELERALEFPWDKWTIFLHPAQRDWVTKDFNGPARVSGSAGTGKTIVALHRAVHLARTCPDSRVLLSTFSEPLANALLVKLRRLIANEPRLGERVEVAAMDQVGQRLYNAAFGDLHLATDDEIDELLKEASVSHADHGFSDVFIRSEWTHVVDAWQLDSWAAYRAVQRLGRKTRLPESRRKVLWEIYDRVRTTLDKRGWLTQAGMFACLARELPNRRHPPYDFVVIDEAQDISVMQLRFLAALGGNRSNAIFFAGDLGQRIFQQPFSWTSLGVDIRGRARTLRINYRTSHQIRRQADCLLDSSIADVDGNEENRAGTVSVFNGPEPVIRTFKSAGDESREIAGWLRTCIEEGLAASEIAVFVRSEKELPRAVDAIRLAGHSGQVMDERLRIKPDQIVAATMHLAKGLEFRAVAVMACDDEVIPAQCRIDNVSDESDLAEVYDTERHLLYVACTRARERLIVSGVDPTSEFLDDMPVRGRDRSIASS